MKSRWPRIALRFSLRSLFVAITFLTISLTVISVWWPRPFVLTGSHSNGTRAWEQWGRRTLLLNEYQHIKTVRFYSNGQRGMEFVSRGNSAVYWSPDGESISEEEWYRFFVADGVESTVD